MWNVFITILPKMRWKSRWNQFVHISRKLFDIYLQIRNLTWTKKSQSLFGRKWTKKILNSSNRMRYESDYVLRFIYLMSWWRCKELVWLINVEKVCFEEVQYEEMLKSFLAGRSCETIKSEDKSTPLVWLTRPQNISSI